MNDRHRYRFWDKESEIMSYDIGIHYTDYYDTSQIISEDGCDKFEADDNCVVMQCTGLKDKNGTLIYEDDIVEWEKPDVKNSVKLSGIVKWHGDFWGVDTGNGYWYLSGVVDRLGEIIGNIHENSDLTESEEK